ncbi:uncharacterized protein LOC105234197 isoform X1 [Bactrocera dorsalis]|uniref:Uncharacterized protein LOC105234197 isoform X1 n=1 Tax=Bactrocera dorsalis TaxID=27457 RepID=A0ABM3JNK8_BACDO|nr:uncharacterized protein LOC105234197 isoform X1 [Bactrocera dorsalis]
MKAAGHFFTLAFVVCCCLSFGLVSGLKCFSCTSNFDCLKPIKLHCTDQLANETLSHLKKYYLNVPSANITRDMNCFSDWLTTATAHVEHKGCIYSSVYNRTYTLRPEFQSPWMRNPRYRSYRLCNRDGCNPAARAGVSLLTIVSAIIVTVLASAVWC